MAAPAGKGPAPTWIQPLDRTWDGTMKEDARIELKPATPLAAPPDLPDSEQDMTILARWLRRAMQQGTKFWLAVAALATLVAAVAVFAGGLGRGKASVTQAWASLATAQSEGDIVEIANDFPNTEVGRLAKIKAANRYFLRGVQGLMVATQAQTGVTSRETGLIELKKALDLFLVVAEESPRDSEEAIAASFGAARTFEARNELTEAIDQYQKIISGWPKSAEAEQSAKIIELLKQPQVIAFYKEFLTYKPAPAIMPGGLAGAGGLPDFTTPAGILIPGLPGINLRNPVPGVDFFDPLPAGPGPALTLPAGPMDIAPPPASTTPPATKPSTAKKSLTNPFAPPAASGVPKKAAGAMPIAPIGIPPAATTPKKTSDVMPSNPFGATPPTPPAATKPAAAKPATVVPPPSNPSLPPSAPAAQKKAPVMPVNPGPVAPTPPAGPAKKPSDAMPSDPFGPPGGKP